MQENNLQKLPNEITRLKNLSVLNVSNNKLNCLPEAMGDLKNLIILDISYNKSLHKLPKSLGCAQSITGLRIDGLKLTYPPEDVQTGGTIVIIAFLANECGIDYSPEDFIQKTEEPNDYHKQELQIQNEDKNLQVYTHFSDVKSFS